MLTVETIRKIRLARHRDGKPIRQIARDLNHSKNTVKKVLRSEATVFHYERNSQPRPKLGPFVESLEARLEQDQKLPKKRRRTAMVLFEQLQAEGYSGAYDSVRRHVRKWRREKRALGSQVFIPLSFERRSRRPIFVCVTAVCF
jgi:transposase